MKENDIKLVTVVRMGVPRYSCITDAAIKALHNSSKKILGRLSPYLQTEEYMDK